jgi:hypothetical protein
MIATPPRPVVELAEWQVTLRSDLALTDTDRALAASLARGQEGRLVVEDLRAGLRLRATSWIGLVRFAGFDVRIVPKLAGERPGLVQLLEFATGLFGRTLTRDAPAAGGGAGCDLRTITSPCLYPPHDRRSTDVEDHGDEGWPVTMRENQAGSRSRGTAHGPRPARR